MTTYKRSDRRHWRYTLRRLAWRVNLLLAALALLAVVWLAQAGAVSAAPRCPGGTATSSGCSYQIDRDTVCVWPVTWQGNRVAWCVRQAVQP